MLKRAEFFLALRYLKPERSAVGVITVISIIGVALGVAVLMIVLAVMTGFTDLMKEKIIDTQAHVQVRSTVYGAFRSPYKYVDMIASGIVDPAKVTRSALQNAVSVAGMLLTTEAAVVDIPSKNPMPAMPDMGAMGGMGGMM